MPKFENCLFLFSKFLLRLFNGHLFFCYPSSSESSCFLNAQKRFFAIIFSILRLRFLHLLFSFFYFNLVKPCFMNQPFQPLHFKRRITRGVFPLLLLFYGVVLFKAGTPWLSRFLCVVCICSGLKIFLSNDFIKEGTFELCKMREVVGTGNGFIVVRRGLWVYRIY